MRIIFCSDYWNARQPDAAYASEVEQATRVGLDYALFSFEQLAEGRDTQRLLRQVEPAVETELAIYRGWMLRPRDYERLYLALATKGLQLINTPQAYQHCHYLPEAYPLIEEITPRSIWLPVETARDPETLMVALAVFKDRPLIVKDYVKSRKHEWAEACYIPSASDQAAVERVVTRFLQLQGGELNVGLVFREFVEFEPLATHSKSGMPLTKEFRLFFLDGQLLLNTPYWEEGSYQETASELPLERFSEVARRVRSRFFTMDVARKLDGQWLIVELGDGQVAGLPNEASVETFYRELIRQAPALV